MKNELVDALALAETYLALGRMHVHIDLLRRQFEEQHEGRMALVVQDVLIRLAQRVAGDLVAHEAAVDEEVLRVARAARIGGQRGQPSRRQLRRLPFYSHGGMAEFLSEDRGDAIQCSCPHPCLLPWLSP